MSDQLTSAEIAAFRELMGSKEALLTISELRPHIDQLKEEAEYRAARRLVLQTWRRGVIFLGGFIAAAIVLKDYLREAIRWLVG